MSLILSALCIGAPESEWAPLPSQGAAFYGGSKEFQRADLRERFEILRGTVNRRREAKQRPPQRAGRGKSPEAVPDTGGRKVKQGGSNFESEMSGTEKERSRW